MPVQLPTPLKDAHEFKPLLTEIEERPASPLGRTIFWVLMAAFATTLTWLCVAEIDVVVTARGKAIPDGHVKVVQPLESGIVSTIRVREGQFVRKGQVLLEIDPSTIEPGLLASQQQLQLARLEIARLRATALGTSFDSSHQTQRQLHAASSQSIESQQAAKDKELAGIKEQVKQTEAELAQNKSLLVVAQERRQRYEGAADIIAKADLEAARAEVIRLESTIVQNQAKLAEFDQAMQRVTNEREQILQSFKTQNLEQLAEREKVATELSAKRAELSFKHRKQQLLAPVDGTVTELSVHTIGGVVSPAQRLMSIMPDKTPVLIEAEVSNDDIGFVKEGLPVHIKVDTFDFQKYGMMEGKVKLVSRDSHEEERTQAKLYRVFVRPTVSELTVDGNKEQLVSGMTGTCEVRVGKRKVIEFFVYPILKAAHNGTGVR